MGLMLLIVSELPSHPSLLTLRRRPTLPIPSISLRSTTKRCSGIAVLCEAAAAAAPLERAPFVFGGWEELEMQERALRSPEPGLLRGFLISQGFGEGKHAFLFLLGFATAMAVSRLRLSTMALIPIFVLVFAAGFSVGLAQCGPMERTMVRASGEKVTDFKASFNEFYGKMHDLSDGFDEFVGAIGHCEAGLGNAEDRHFETVNKNLKSWTEDTVKAARSSVDIATKKKSSETTGDFGNFRAELFQFCRGWFLKRGDSAKPTRRKECSEGSAFMDEMRLRYRSIVGNNEKGGMRSMPGKNKKNIAKCDDDDVDDGVRSFLPSTRYGEKRISRSGDCGVGDDILLYEEEPDEMRNWYIENNRQRSYRNTYFQEEYESEASVVSSNYRFSGHRTFERAPNSSMLEASPLFDQSVAEDEILQRNGADVGEMSMRFKDRLSSGNQLMQELEEGGLPLASNTSTVEKFEQLVKGASELLKHTRVCLSNQRYKEEAEMLLYRSERLLSEAVSINPKSLLAVGQLGNTYLLHGELKFKSSRELRAFLCGSDELGVQRLRCASVGIPSIGKKGVATALHEMCEESEALFIEAGRKYRLALSIDKKDNRALYNWGLALAFRAQLIADTGPEAASDADKVFMAAVDMFCAVTSRSCVCRPKALLRWGSVLQQRSRLRLHSSKEKMKLLHQAKALFEDALLEESDNEQARDALKFCKSELSYRAGRSYRR